MVIMEEIGFHRRGMGYHLDPRYPWPPFSTLQPAVNRAAASPLLASGVPQSLWPWRPGVHPIAPRYAPATVTRAFFE